MDIIGTYQGFVDSPFDLFNKGTWNGLQTTGITKVWDGSTNGGSFGASSGSSQITLFLSGGASTAMGKGQARFNSVVDLTPYKYLKAQYAGGGRATVYLGVSANSNLQSFSYNAYTSFQGQSSGIYIIDISGLSGNYYIYLGATDQVGQYDRELHFDRIFLSNT